MRFIFFAALAASMWAAASRACQFDAFAVDQTRVFAVDLSLYVNGTMSQSYRLEQPFLVDYYAVLDVAADRTTELPQLTIRPQEMLPPTELEVMFDPVTRVVFTFAVPEPPAPWLPVVPPDIVSILAYYHRPDLGFVPNTATGFALNSPRSRLLLSDSTQTIVGWDVAVTGPWNDPEPEQWVTQLGAELFQTRFDIAATNWGWIEAAIPLTAPDCFCFGDFNEDGHVDQVDLDMVLLDWGSEPRLDNWKPSAPVVVGQSSLDKVLLGWGDVSPPKLLGAEAVPEPAALLILAVILAAGAIVKRGR